MGKISPKGEMMHNEVSLVTIKYIESNFFPSANGVNWKLEATYTMTHQRNGCQNEYRVVCQLNGLRDHKPYLVAVSAEREIGFRMNNETLTEKEAIELFDNHS